MAVPASIFFRTEMLWANVRCWLSAGAFQAPVGARRSQRNTFAYWQINGLEVLFLESGGCGRQTTKSRISRPRLRAALSRCSIRLA